VIRERSTRRSKFSHGGASPMVQLNAPMFARTAPATPQANGSLMRRSDDPARAPLLDAHRQPNTGGLGPPPPMGGNSGASGNSSPIMHAES
jgi:hypothetical protein